MAYNLITILGPTAVGKTRLAALLARRFDGEIISADSRQVYRSMDIGTGKDLKDYEVEGQTVPFHMIDIADPSEEFNLYRFLVNFYSAYENIRSRGRMPFLAGGTGMYLNAVLQKYQLREIDSSGSGDELNALSEDELRGMLLKINPNLHNSTDLKDKERIVMALRAARAEKVNAAIAGGDINPLIIGVHAERSLLKERITARLKQRLSEGMLDEVQQLLDSGISYEKLIFFGLEYKFAAQYLKGELSYNDMFQKLNSAIHSFAKRQMTWYRKMEREGVVIHWIEGADFEKAEKIIAGSFGQPGKGI